MTFNVSHVTQSCQKTWKKDSSLKIKKSHPCHIKQTVFDTTIITDRQHAFHPSIINFCFPDDAAGVRSARLVATVCTIPSMSVDGCYHTAQVNPSGYGCPLFVSSITVKKTNISHSLCAFLTNYVSESHLKAL